MALFEDGVFGKARFTNNVQVDGTLSVTGATTQTGAYGVTGDFSVNTNKFNVTAASGNTAVAGTLGVTGATTLARANVTSLKPENGTVTLVSNAGTLNKMAGLITTESLTTAAGASQDLTITCTACAAGDIILLTRNGGSNSAGTLNMKVTPGAGSFVINLSNQHASAAFNGTFVIGFLILKAV